MVRDIERLVIVIIAGMAVYLGFKLFYVVTTKQGEMRLGGNNYNLQLQDVAPGIYFALFGSIVLVIALFQRVSQENIQETKLTTSSSSKTVTTINRTTASNSSSYSSDLFLDTSSLTEEQMMKYSQIIEYLNILTDLQSLEASRPNSIRETALEDLKQEVLKLNIEPSFEDLVRKSDSINSLQVTLRSYSIYFVESPKTE